MVQLTKKQITDLAFELRAEPKLTVNIHSIAFCHLVAATTDVRYFLWHDIEIMQGIIYFRFYSNFQI